MPKQVSTTWWAKPIHWLLSRMTVLLQLCDQKTSMDSAFRIADGVLHHGVQAIAETITVPGLINLDFADIRTIMKDAWPCMDVHR